MIFSSICIEITLEMKMCCKDLDRSRYSRPLDNKARARKKQKERNVLI